MVTRRQLMDVANRNSVGIASIPVDVRAALNEFHWVYDSLEACSEKCGLGLHHGFLRGSLLGLLEDLDWTERESIPKMMLVADRLIDNQNVPTPESRLTKGMWWLWAPIQYTVSDDGSYVMEKILESRKYPFVEQVVPTLHERYGYFLKPSFLGRKSVDSLTKFFDDYSPALVKGACHAYLEGRIKAYSTEGGEPRKGHDERIGALESVLLRHF